MKFKVILRKYRSRFTITLILIVLEVLLALLFPLFIGNAIDGIVQGNPNGTILLALLGMAVLVIGIARRMFDSRFYANVYEDMGTTTISKMDANLSSKKVAHLSMIRELIEFLENTMPELVGTTIGLIGVIGIMATLNLTVFYGSLIAGVLVFFIYWWTSSKTTQLNKASNDEFEKQVAIISKNDGQALKIHLGQMMKWNIKLSDLEAVNFSISWIVLIGFLVSSIVIVASDGIIQYGALFALMMYVFQFMENVINLPLFYQNWLRLREIIHRLEDFQSTGI